MTYTDGPYGRGRNISDYSDAEIRKEVDENHIWLNAFRCIRPTDEFLAEIGRLVLQKLHDSDMRDGLGISPTVIIRFNKS